VIPGEFVFNVLHLDGHVHDSPYPEAIPAETAYNVNDGGLRPLGWRWKADKNDGVELTPGISCAVDMN
jgi:prepilin-type processing-associated H-X9-DG protein